MTGMGPAPVDAGRGVSDFVRHRIEVPMHLRVSLFGAYARSFSNAPEPPMCGTDAEEDLLELAFEDGCGGPQPH